MSRRSWLALAGLIWLVCGAHASLAAPLTLCIEDTPFLPWSSPDGHGLNLDLVRSAAAQLNEQVAFVPKPWKRCLEQARTGVVDGVVGVAVGPDRLVYGAFPTLPDGSLQRAAALYEEPVWIFTRIGSQASWDGKTLINPNRRVISQRGFLVADVLRERGSEVFDNVKSIEEGLRSLVAGVADVAALQGHLAQEMAVRDPRFAGKVLQAAQPYVSYDYYLMISKMTYARDPARIQALWDAIARVRQTPEYRRAQDAALAKMRP